MELNKVHNIDCLTGLKQLKDNNIDLIATDPPYGLKFMGKNWDKALPDINVFKECYRVLKPGCWCLVMSAPRSDLQSRMSLLLEDAGFNIGYTPIYWTFASGFPKAGNLGKMADKRLGKEREVVGNKPIAYPDSNCWGEPNKTVPSKGFGQNNNDYGNSKEGFNLHNNPITTPSSDQAKALDGSYAGFQPKPAVEVVLVAMKPLSEKTYIDQALKSLEDESVGLGGSWLDDARIPYKNDDDKEGARTFGKHTKTSKIYGEYNSIGNKVLSSNNGRFPANLLVSDDILNDGIERKTNGHIPKTRFKQDTNCYGKYGKIEYEEKHLDNGSFSRYFDLDIWFDNLPENVRKTFPFLLVPKASKSEKNKGLNDFNKEKVNDGRKTPIDNPFQRGETLRTNKHPTVKPLKLFTYLITLFSRPGQTVLDPYTGSGTTCIAAKLLNRNYIGFELEEEYKIIADARLTAYKPEIEKEIPLTAF